VYWLTLTSEERRAPELKILGIYARWTCQHGACRPTSSTGFGGAHDPGNIRFSPVSGGHCLLATSLFRTGLCGGSVLCLFLLPSRIVLCLT
jgi:hypothetical protein